MEQYNNIQQAYKKNPGEEKKPVSFTTPIQAVYDGKTGASLEAILAQFNSIYVQYQGSPKDTRLIIPKEMRRAGLTITYMDMESNTITERANSAVQKDNDHWALDVNWSRVDELSLSGDISVSAAGTWIINGKDTGVKALGPKGDTGLTPWLKTIENRLHFSYDNETWEPCSENIAAWFRWSGNKIQISRDNKTWTDLSGKFADNIHIKGYVASTAALPSGASQGDIYGVGPTYAAEDTAHTNPIYRYYVRNANAWVDNGSFTSISAGVVQKTGYSETEVMSQKAVTEKLSELGSEVSSAMIDNDIFDIVDDFGLTNRKFDATNGTYVDSNVRVSSKIIDAESKSFIIKSINNGVLFFVYISYNGTDYSLLTIPTSVYGGEIGAEIHGVKSFVLVAQYADNSDISVNDVTFYCVKSKYSNIVENHEIKQDIESIYKKKGYDKVSLYFRPMNFDRVNGVFKDLNSKTRWSTKISITKNSHIYLKSDVLLLMCYSEDNGVSWSDWVSPLNGVIEHTFAKNSLVVFVLSDNKEFDGNEVLIYQCETDKEVVNPNIIDKNLEYTIGAEFDVIDEFYFKNRNYDFTNNNYKDIGDRKRSASNIIDIEGKKIALLQRNSAIQMIYYTSIDGVSWQGSGYVLANDIYVITEKKYLICIASSNPLNNEFNTSDIDIVSLKYGKSNQAALATEYDDKIKTNDVVSDGFWIKPTDVSGRITDITNPYKEVYPNQYMGQLHCHSYYWTENSDYGITRTRENAEIVYNLYKDLGFDFLTITNYPYCGGLTPRPVNDNAMVWLCNSYEGSVATQANGIEKRAGTHLLFLNAEKIYSDAIIEDRTANEMIEQAISDKVVPVLAHPMWAQENKADTFYEKAELLALPRNLKFVEVYNTISPSKIQTVYSENNAYALDVLASDGRIVWGVGVSDSHNFKLPNGSIIDTDQVKGGNIKVFAAKKSASAIWESIMNGNYYSCSDYRAKLDAIELVDNLLTIKIKDIDAVTKFYGQDAKLLTEVVGSNPSYKIVGNEKYVRAEITTSLGYKIWTNPIYLWNPSK